MNEHPPHRTAKKAIVLTACAALASFALFAGTACSSTSGTTEGAPMKISAEEAYETMQEQPDAVILDVRQQSEFDAGHIPGATLLPLDRISEETAAAAIPSKESTVLVYCRSGNRSATATSELARMGYLCVYDFGGINTWPYEVTTD